MKIAIVDYVVTANNPAGSCHLQMLRDLCREHEFTVFSLRFENPCPERIEWVRIPAPRRPLALLFVVYHLLWPAVFRLYCLRRKVRFDLVQAIECNAVGQDIAYAHFCHALYLRKYWKNSGMTGLRRALRYLDHKLHAMLEPHVYRRARLVVAPSRGLARELENEYPWLSGKITVIANPVDLDRWRRPRNFDVLGFRRTHGLDSERMVLAFVALGQFERKGLPILLDYLESSRDSAVQLLVVGGESDLVSGYRRECVRRGIGKQVIFTGMQSDVRPFLWASDAFILPSSYEVFPLVCLQAAAAGLPLFVSKLNGVEEFLVPGKNGFLIERSATDVKRLMDLWCSLNPEDRLAMGLRAQKDVERYAAARFSLAWRDLYEQISEGKPGALKQVA